MVYYFTSTSVDPPARIYVGKDKHENEELIKHGWEDDFHVDKLSSAHIYLRLPYQPSYDWTTLPDDLLIDLAQLTKANSIEGNKKENVSIIYTPWSNLRKDGSMDVGQVSFKDPRQVRRVLVPTRENAIVNRLNKTKIEKLEPELDLYQEREDRLRELRKRDMVAVQARKKEEVRVAKERKEKKRQKDHAYDDFFNEESLAASSNQDRDENFLDDFM